MNAKILRELLEGKKVAFGRSCLHMDSDGFFNISEHPLAYKKDGEFEPRMHSSFTDAVEKSTQMVVDELKLLQPGESIVLHNSTVIVKEVEGGYFVKKPFDKLEKTHFDEERSAATRALSSTIYISEAGDSYSKEDIDNAIETWIERHNVLNVMDAHSEIFNHVHNLLDWQCPYVIIHEIDEGDIESMGIEFRKPNKKEEA